MRNALLKNNKKFLQRLNFCRLSLAFWKDKTVLKRKSSCNCKLSCYQPLTSKDGQGSVSLNHNGPWNDSFISAKAWERLLRAWPYSWRVHPENIPWRSFSWGPDHHGDPELINSWGPKFESNIYCVTPVPLCISFIDKIKSHILCLFVCCPSKWYKDIKRHWQLYPAENKGLRANRQIIWRSYEMIQA